jgi:uncharacterized membrane protein YdjX (TVP38/TMEM64 family)
MQLRRPGDASFLVFRGLPEARGILLAVLLLLAAGLAALSLLRPDWISVAVLIEHRQTLADAFASAPWRWAIAFLLLYILTISLFLPTVALLATSAGAVFGFGLGFALSLFGALVGAGIGFLLSRYLFSTVVRRRWPGVLARIDHGMAEEGAFYLFALRLVPVFPFAVVNFALGLTRISLRQYLLVTCVGASPSLLLLVNAGVQIAEASVAPQPLTPALLISLSLLGLFPLAARLAVSRLRRRWLTRL